MQISPEGSNSSQPEHVSDIFARGPIGDVHDSERERTTRASDLDSERRGSDVDMDGLREATLIGKSLDPDAVEGLKGTALEIAVDEIAVRNEQRPTKG